MWQISVKFVPQLLTHEQKLQHVFVHQEVLKSEMTKTSSKVIMGEKPCVYGYNPETKQQSSW